VIFEDDDMLVVNKPAGLNTHAPSRYAGEGLYDWLRHREPRWAALAIIHRLDKETSGAIVFSKTSLANRSLTAQFTQREARKKYLLLTDRPVRQKEFTVNSALVRVGEKYVSRPLHAGSDLAETRFRLLAPAEVHRFTSTLGFGLRALDLVNVGTYSLLEAQPLTGRTHQVRVHAADQGLPILGDALYGGTPAPRVCLHAVELTLRHPGSGLEMTFRAPLASKTMNPYPGPLPSDGRGGWVPSESSERWAGQVESLRCSSLRAGLIEPEETNAYRLIHGASDGWPGWYVERLGDFLLSQSEQMPGVREREELERLLQALSARGAYHKILARKLGRASAAEACPQHLLGQAEPERFAVRENRVHFEVSFSGGYSVGLFLDQRDNRRRLLTGHIAAGFSLLANAGPTSCRSLISDPGADCSARRHAGPAVLNTFAYTCGFSLCAAKAGARTTSLDLSNKYLLWGRRNFLLNQINPAEHEFICGDTFDWLRRLGKKHRLFDVILLDPPTFSQSKEFGVFQARKDYRRLVAAALPLLESGGVVFASTNAADWAPQDFLQAVETPIRLAKRTILQRHYAPQPPDFPISRSEPGYLKTVWLRIN